MMYSISETTYTAVPASLFQIHDCTVGLTNGPFRHGVGGCVGVGNGDAPKGPTSCDPGRFLWRDFIQLVCNLPGYRVLPVGIAVGPAIDRNSFRIIFEFEVPTLCFLRRSGRW